MDKEVEMTVARWESAGIDLSAYTVAEMAIAIVVGYSLAYVSINGYDLFDLSEEDMDKFDEVVQILADLGVGEE